MARDLSRLLEAKISVRENLIVPASDRSASLDHNSQQYRDAIATAEDLERVIEEANDIDPEEKDQHAAEVSAVRRLLEAARVRLEPIVSLLRPLADQAKAKLKDTMIGMVVTKFLALLGALLGYLWSTL